jgi:hypothetical protein
VNTVPDLNKATALAATGQTKAAAAPRVKLLSHGFCIDHPDPELGEQLMADALGVADRDAMHGILRQLVRASYGSASHHNEICGLTIPVLDHRARNASLGRASPCLGSPQTSSAPSIRLRSHLFDRRFGDLIA